MKARHELIRDQYLHGERFTAGNRVAEACRVDSCCGHWNVFRYLDGVPVRGQTDKNMGYHDARRIAREWAEQSLEVAK